MAQPVNPSRAYEEYNPPSELSTEEGCDIILLYLPGTRQIILYAFF